jgi:hypothetical protein
MVQNSSRFGSDYLTQKRQPYRSSAWKCCPMRFAPQPRKKSASDASEKEVRCQHADSRVDNHRLKGEGECRRTVGYSRISSAIRGTDTAYTTRRLVVFCQDWPEVGQILELGGIQYASANGGDVRKGSWLPVCLRGRSGRKDTAAEP